MMNNKQDILRLHQDHISYRSHFQPEAKKPAVTG